MISILNSRAIKVLLACLLTFSAVNAAGNTGQDKVNSILTVMNNPTTPALAKIADSFKKNFTDQPGDNLLKMMYGYTQLFIASDYLEKKNYFPAAEFAKRGFFYVDEAAETEPDNWRLRYLRVRLDAFVPAKLGRCAIAHKDLQYLMSLAGAKESALKPFLYAMLARIKKICPDLQYDKPSLDLASIAVADQELSGWIKNQHSPELRDEELSDIILPLIREKI